MSRKENTENKQNRNQKIKEITEQLKQGVVDLFDSDKYKAYLHTMSKFSNYSFNNSLLIWLQRPDASAVAGYRAWGSKFNRHVKEGSTSIKIIAPTPYKIKMQEKVLDENGRPILDAKGNEVTQEVEQNMMGFKVEHVFAYEDTEGTPLPSILSILDKDVSDYTERMGILTAVSPVPIHVTNFDSNANGYYSLEERAIYVKESLPELQKIKTTIHELSHYLLHDKVIGEDQEATRNEREVCAESVAFTVCSYLGLDTSDYSFGYIGGWSKGKELKELQEKMELIRRTSDSIIASIEKELIKRRMEKEDTLAFKNATGYLLIEKVDAGFHYETFNPNYERNLQGMVYDETLSMNEAVDKITRTIGTNPDAWNPFNVESLAERTLGLQVEQEIDATKETKKAILHKR